MNRPPRRIPKQRSTRYDAAVDLDQAAMKIRNEMRRPHPDERKVTMLRERIFHAMESV